jgi:hypothetical protein
MMRATYADRVLTSTAQVPAERPERYVKQLVSHLAHRRTTRWEPPDAGVVEWPDGRCRLLCTPGVLILTATGDDADVLAQVQDVIGRHLERFGARDGLRVHWSAPA